MPSLDGGHYFLTALLPIDDRGIIEHDGLRSSPVHMVREALETLPTALQSPASARIGLQSPFARSLRTHFARFVVIDAPFDNGRDPADSILSAIQGTDLLSPQPLDRLNCPYLFFAAEFDPAGDGASEPRAYLEELWTLAESELKSIFEFCYGFEQVAVAADFAAYVIRGEVETTMPFNDYWTNPPPFPSLATWQLAGPPLLGLILGIAAPAILHWPWWGGILFALALTLSGVWVDYAWVMAAGARPLPTAPNSTLKDVLKALYLQQAFARFAVTHQGSSPAELRAAFQDFVVRTRPDDVTGPTQPPGVIRTADA
jgi:hypothetical protein